MAALTQTETRDTTLSPPMSSHECMIHTVLTTGDSRLSPEAVGVGSHLQAPGFTTRSNLVPGIDRSSFVAVRSCTGVRLRQLHLHRSQVEHGAREHDSVMVESI